MRSGDLRSPRPVLRLSSLLVRLKLVLNIWNLDWSHDLDIAANLDLDSYWCRIKMISLSRLALLLSEVLLPEGLEELVPAIPQHDLHFIRHLDSRGKYAFFIAEELPLELFAHLEPLFLEHIIEGILIDVLLQLILPDELCVLVSYKSGGFQLILKLLDALLETVHLVKSLLLLLNHLVFDGELGIFDGGVHLGELGSEPLALLVL